MSLRIVEHHRFRRIESIVSSVNVLDVESFVALLQCLRCNLLESPVVRVLLMIVTLILVFTTSFVNTVRISDLSFHRTLRNCFVFVCYLVICLY
jgi:hypothetical protein